MTQKIVYFTAGAVPTVEEAADIEALNALTQPPYAVKVSNGSVPPNLGMRPNPDPDPEPEDPEIVPVLMDCDFVAGTIPADYDGLPVFDPQNPPDPNPLPGNQAVVTDGQELEVEGGTVTLSVEDGIVSATFTPEE